MPVLHALPRGSLNEVEVIKFCSMYSSWIQLNHTPSYWKKGFWPTSLNHDYGYWHWVGDFSASVAQFKDSLKNFWPSPAFVLGVKLCAQFFTRTWSPEPLEMHHRQIHTFAQRAACHVCRKTCCGSNCWVSLRSLTSKHASSLWALPMLALEWQAISRARLIFTSQEQFPVLKGQLSNSWLLYVTAMSIILSTALCIPIFIS